MVISREAADKQKGFRLQKIRAISVMLDLIESIENPFIYAATEFFEDVYIKNSTPGQEKEIFEEDKNYDPASSFSFNNPTLRNTLVSFIDIWMQKGHGVSDKIFFCFYATNKAVKERKSNLTKELNITLPEKPLLEFAQNKNFEDRIIIAIKTFMLHEYKCQYDNKQNNGFYDVIEKWSDVDWRKFLSRIDWMFGQQDEVALKKEAIEKIKNCKHFSIQHCDGLEEQIFNNLMEKFDSRQNAVDPLERFVYGAEFELAFKDSQIGSFANINPQKRSDPVWKMWESLPEPTDKRIISEKIIEICPSFNQKAIQYLAIKVTRNYFETQPVKTDKHFLSYRYRIYEHCVGKLYELLKNLNRKIEVTENDVQLWIKTLINSSCENMKELAIDYRYPFNNEKMVEGVVLELFDTCFLSFDYAG